MEGFYVLKDTNSEKYYSDDKEFFLNQTNNMRKN